MRIFYLISIILVLSKSIDAQSYTPLINHDFIWIVQEFNEDSSNVKYFALKFDTVTTKNSFFEPYTFLSRYNLSDLSENAVIEHHFHEAVLREDMEDQRVYSVEPQFFCFTPPWPEFLVFDFKLSKGDTLKLADRFNEVIKDSVDTFFDVERAYIKTSEDNENLSFLVEGIGSLTGEFTNDKFSKTIVRELLHYCESGTIVECLKAYGRRVVSSTQFDAHEKSKIYPNPVADVLKVNMEEFKRYNIFNHLGQLICHGSIQNAEVEVGHLNRGNYFIQFSHDKGQRIFRFVKL